jgi:hypothetical protein
MEFKFEKIDAEHFRTKVPGGWIVKAYERVVHNSDINGMIDGWDWRIAMVFIPDQFHKWTIDKEG